MLSHDARGGGLQALRVLGPAIVPALLVGACSPTLFADVGSAQSFTVEQVAPAVADGRLEELMSDVGRRTSDPATRARWMRFFQQLGPLKSSGMATCQVTSSFNTNPDLSGEFANCSVDAVYANANARVTVRLRRVGNGWQADMVNVNSDYFAALMEKGAAGAEAPAPDAPPGTAPPNAQPEAPPSPSKAQPAPTSL